MSHGKVSAKQLSSLTTTTYPSPAPRNALSLPKASGRARGCVWSEQGRSCRANRGSQHRQKPCNWHSLSLTCSQVNRSRTESICVSHRGEVPEPLPDTRGTDIRSPSCSWLPWVPAKALGCKPFSIPIFLSSRVIMATQPFLWFPLVSVHNYMWP